NIDFVKFDQIYWKYRLTEVIAFLTKENINNFLKSNGFKRETRLLHIDIDGNDPYIRETINVVKPITLISEYNKLFGAENNWVIPYAANFFRTNTNYSSLYCGSSLASLFNLSEKRGYMFIRGNSAGNNAYFSKKEFA